MNEEELIKACEDGDLKKVESLVEKGFDINAKNNYGWTALMWASTIGISTIDIVKYLVKEGADINAKNNYGWTALMFASMVGSFDIVKHLIYKGSDINIKNNDGDTALILISNMRDNNNNNIINSILTNATSHKRDTLLNGEDLKTISILIGNGVNYKSSNSGMRFNEDIKIKIENNMIYVENEKNELLSKYNDDDIEKEN